MKKIILLLPLLLIIFWSCQNDAIDEDLQNNTQLQTTNTVRRQVKEIMLWGAKATVVDHGDYYLFQGDMIVGKDEVEEINQNPTLRTLATKDRLWTNGIVYYTDKTGNSSLGGRIQSAIQEIENKTHIRFRKRNGEANYINITLNSNPFEGKSVVGMLCGSQDMQLGIGVTTGLIVHEFGHALGLLHEHSRPDRDKYVKVNTQYLDSPNDYAIYNGKTFGLPFDYNSIMLYPTYYKNPGQPMMTLPNGSELKRNSVLSAGDVYTLFKLYPSLPFNIVRQFSDCPCNGYYRKFQVSNLPANMSIIWSGSNGAQLISTVGNTAEFRFTGNQYATITATISIPGYGEVVTLSEQVWVGVPSMPRILSDNGNEGKLLYPNSSYSFSTSTENFSQQKVDKYYWNGSQGDLLQRISTYTESRLNVYLEVANNCGKSLSASRSFGVLVPTDPTGPGPNPIGGFD